MMTDTNRKSALKHGSEQGLLMGLYLFLMSACLLASVHVQGLVMLILPLMLGWPVVLWCLMRSVWKGDEQYRAFAPIWLTGMWTCIFGALICAALSTAWLLLFQPDFLTLYLRQCIEQVQLAGLHGEYDAMASSLQQAIDNHAVPSPLQWVFSMIWLTAFAGFVISLAVAVALQMKKPSSNLSGNRCEF